MCRKGVLMLLVMIADLMSLNGILIILVKPDFLFSLMVTLILLVVYIPALVREWKEEELF